MIGKSCSRSHKQLLWLIYQNHSFFYREIQSTEHAFCRLTPSFNWNRSFSFSIARLPSWKKKIRLKIISLYLTRRIDLTSWWRMGNSIVPHLESAKKTGVCSLCGKGLSEVRHFGRLCIFGTNYITKKMV